jgi:hypothetical protein
LADALAAAPALEHLDMQFNGWVNAGGRRLEIGRVSAGGKAALRAAASWLGEGRYEGGKTKGYFDDRCGPDESSGELDESSDETDSQ